jgi:uncharacterized protein YdaU (DUF1376 family)
MHYYSFHVSDYIHDTAHLSAYEDLAFRRLLDLYYTSEKPIPNKTHEVARRIRMSAQINAVQTVLEEFFMFDMENDCWFHKRCDKAIADYQAKAERNREVGKLGGRPKTNPSANPQETQMVSKDNPNQEPITNNHKPITNNQDKKALGKRLANDFSFPLEWEQFCKETRPELHPTRTFDQFKDYWIAQAGQKGVKLDWFATWRNWVRSTNAPKQNPADIGRVTVPPSNEPDAALEKIKADDKKAAPIPLEVLAKMAELRKRA